MPWIFPRRQWQSRLAVYPGQVSAGLPEDAPPSVPSPGSHLTTFSFQNLSLSLGVPMTPTGPTIQPSGSRIVVFFLAPNLPPGLSFNNATGFISGTPTQALASTQFTLRADAAISYFTRFNLSVS